MSKYIYQRPSGNFVSVSYKNGGLKYHGTYPTIKEAKDARDSGHWVGLTPEPKNYFGFIYLITDSVSEMKYVGFKQYKFFRSPCVSSNNMDKPEWNDECWYESDWKNYNSSSKLLKPLVKERPDDFEFRILSQHRSKLALVKAEIMEMEARDVLYSKLYNGEREYFNQHIGSAEYNMFDRSSANVTHGKSKTKLYRRWGRFRAYDLLGPEWKDNPEDFMEFFKEAEDKLIKRIDESLQLTSSNYEITTRAELVRDKEYNSKSGITGVRLHTGYKDGVEMWIAEVKSKGVSIHIGTFDSPVLAAYARNNYIRDNNLMNKLS